MHMEHPKEVVIEPQTPLLLAPLPLLPTCIRFHLRQKQNCVLKLPLQTALRRNILFPEVDTTCLFRDIYQYNASNKIKAIHRKLFQRDSVTSFSFLKSKREEKKKQMQIATHRILCWRCTERFKSSSRFLANAYSLTQQEVQHHLASTSSGRQTARDQFWAASKFIFTLLGTKLQGHKCLRVRHAREA